MIWKRYQIWTSKGLEWSRWFLIGKGTMEKWQIKGKQLNEYRETDGEEPPTLSTK